MAVSYDFIFDGKKLSDFGYMVCKFSNSNTETIPVSDITFNTIKIPNNKWVKTSSSYENVLSATIQICKNPCVFSDSYISDYEISNLTRWLCRKNYKKFKIFKNKNYHDFYFEVQINLNKIEVYSRCVGLELTVTANHSYAVSDNSISFTAIANKNYDIVCFSDDEGFIYPESFSVKCLEAGNLSITNAFEDRTTIINNCSVISFDNLLQIYTSDINHTDIQNDFNYVCPRLCSTYENYTNTFSFSINCEVIIKYQTIKKVGL